jgi:putative heme iron utilization protein
MKHLPYEATGKAIKGYSESETARRETNDCVVRAFASSFEVSYDYAHKFVADEFGRRPRKGTYGTVSKLVKMADSLFKVNGKKVCPVGIRHNDNMLRSLMYDVKVKGEIKKRNMTVGTFVKQNPKGTFFVLVRRHAFTIKDGVVIGNWDDAIKTKRPMRCAFEIK